MYDIKEWFANLGYMVKDWFAAFVDKVKANPVKVVLFLVVLFSIFFAYLAFAGKANAHGYGVPVVAPHATTVVTTPVVTHPSNGSAWSKIAGSSGSQQPAAGAGSESVMLKVVPLLIGALAVYIFWCMANEEEQKEYCEREETPVWPGS